MIKGLGIDLVMIQQVEAMLRISKNTKKYIFTEKELTLSEQAINKAEFLAGRFAAKEAVCKAISPHIKQPVAYDFRIVETLKREDGSPYINIGPELQSLVIKAGINSIAISLSHQGDFAIAIAIIE